MRHGSYEWTPRGAGVGVCDRLSRVWLSVDLFQQAMHKGGKTGRVKGTMGGIPCLRGFWSGAAG